MNANSDSSKPAVCIDRSLAESHRAFKRDDKPGLTLSRIQSANLKHVLIEPTFEAWRLKARENLQADS